MTLKLRPLALVLATALVSAFAIACDSQSQAEIIQTSQAEDRNANATATSLAGGVGGVAVGSGSLAEQAQLAARATATALAASGAPTATPTSGPVAVEVPDGPALTDADNPTIEMMSTGEFVENVIKVKVGTTVTWTTSRRTSISTTSLPGEAEQWDSGPMFKPTFGEAPPFKHTFTIPGCHRYQSTQSTERIIAAVCVEA